MISLSLHGAQTLSTLINDWLVFSSLPSDHQNAFVQKAIIATSFFWTCAHHGTGRTWFPAEKPSQTYFISLNSNDRSLFDRRAVQRARGGGSVTSVLQVGGKIEEWGGTDLCS